MAARIALFASLLGLAFSASSAATVHPIERRLEFRKTTAARVLSPNARDAPDPSTLYPAYNLSVPIDHFHNSTLYAPHTDDTFALRYWFDASSYAPGGPVIVLQSGETSGTDRLGFLQKGLLQQLARATHGIAVVLEHRYYGASFPVPDLSTPNLRFLTTEQALADEAYFARNVVFPGLENRNLTSYTTAYIGYGGSYAGAFNAFLRKLYPDVFWGTISSSGVTEAVYDYWQYFEPIKVYGPKKCIQNQQRLTHVVDRILLAKKPDTRTTQQLKDVFGLGGLTHDDDFASVLAYGIQGWQGRNWDPELNDPSFDLYCGNITADSILYPETASLKSAVEALIELGGHPREAKSLAIPMLNYIGYVNLTAVSSCSGNLDSCFSNYNTAFYERDDINQSWRSWPYQYCTQWGYLATGSGVPPRELPLISRTQDLEYSSIICRAAFNITTPPDTQAINKYGGYGISYPRLAIIDGEQDPWRPATPHASPFVDGVENRTSTTSEPFILIAGGVHHWDENGLFANETTADLPPEPVADTQKDELRFVKEWMEEWKREQRSNKKFVVA